MSWIDKLENAVFQITTGDGKLWTPQWRSNSTEKEFNTTVYEFINQEGAFIDRKKVKARKFPLTFWFSGANNIELADAFDLSANDNRAWRLNHPFYGVIIGQPLNISRNDTNFNSTEITVEFWETIRGNFPVRNLSVKDEIKDKLIQFKDVSATEYANKVSLKPADAATILSLSSKINALISNSLDSLNYSEYQKYKNDMFAKIDDVITAPSSAIKAVQSVVEAPSNFNASVMSRFNLINSIYGQIKGILGKPTRNNKAYFEAVGGMAIAAIANTLVTPLDGDYVVRTDVASVAVLLNDIYKDYSQALDDGYVNISEIDNSFSAGIGTQEKLKQIVVQTISELGVIAFEAKQERTVLLEKDSNIILLTHKYMGLDAEDLNLSKFRVINNIKNKALFVLKKGRKIKYYV